MYELWYTIAPLTSSLPRLCSSSRQALKVISCWSPIGHWHITHPTTQIQYRMPITNHDPISQHLTHTDERGTLPPQTASLKLKFCGSPVQIPRKHIGIWSCSTSYLHESWHIQEWWKVYWNVHAADVDRAEHQGSSRGSRDATENGWERLWRWFRHSLEM